MTTRQCVFCGGSGLTGEHVFPAWLQKYFGQEVMSENVLDKGSGEKPKRWSAKLFSLVTNSVCDTCNHGWMSKLETATKPILGPMASWRLNQSPNQLVGRDQQKALALWAVKTFYVLASMYPADRKIPDKHYIYLYENQTPPPGTLVLLSFRDEPYSAKGTRTAGFYIDQASQIKIRPADISFMERQKKQGKRFYSGHIVLGNVVLSVVSHNFKNTGVILRNMPEGFAYMLSPTPEHSQFTWPHVFPIELHGGIDNFQATIEAGLTAESLYSEAMDSILRGGSKG